jgi:hypothetical protein
MAYRIRIRKGRPVAADKRARLAKIVAVVGDNEIAEAIGCSVPTLCRVLAGLEVYPVTDAAVSAYLDRQPQAA